MRVPESPRVREIPLDQALRELQDDIIRRTVPLVGDSRASVREILGNNLRILEDLRVAEQRAARARALVDHAISE